MNPVQVAAWGDFFKVRRSAENSGWRGLICHWLCYTLWQCSEVTNTCVGDPVHEQVMNWFTRSRTWSRNVIFLDYLVILFMSRSWTDHEVMNCSWTRVRVEHHFFRRQPQFFFCGFQEHGRQGYLHDFGRENTLNPTGICHDLRTDK